MSEREQSLFDEKVRRTLEHSENLVREAKKLLNHYGPRIAAAQQEAKATLAKRHSLLGDRTC